MDKGGSWESRIEEVGGSDPPASPPYLWLIGGISFKDIIWIQAVELLQHCNSFGVEWRLVVFLNCVVTSYTVYGCCRTSTDSLGNVVQKTWKGYPASCKSSY